MNTTVDLRSPNPKVPFGYVHTTRTRVGFHVETRDNKLRGKVCLWATRPEGHWPNPTQREYVAAAQALVDTGLVASLDDIAVSTT